MSPENDENAEYEKLFAQVYEAKSPDYHASLNIALVGKVSSGKSSLLNAILERPRENPIAKVGAESGVTDHVIPYHLDEKVLIIDCPGLDDIESVNSKITRDFLESIDLGIFIVTGSADATQKANFDKLKSRSINTLLVLNKVDEWDHLEDSALSSVTTQWKQALGADRLFETCAKGYDPKARQSAAMDVRGVDELREQILVFLKGQKKDLLLSKTLLNKNKYALRVIAGALTAVAGESFLPGSAVYITATQVTAIIALVYLYTGEIMSRTSALGMLPAFLGESLGTNIFLWAKSFLPPTGVVDAAAAAVAIIITFGMLAAVKWMLENEYSLNDTKQLKLAFKVFEAAGAELKNVSLADLKDTKALLTFLLRIVQGVVVPAR